MTARPPRAATRGERRAKTRGGTQSERAATKSKRRTGTAAPTNPFVRIDDAEILEDEILEEELVEQPGFGGAVDESAKVVIDPTSLARASSDMASVELDVEDAGADAAEPDPRTITALRFAILEAGPHLAAAQAAIVAAGHTVVVTGRDAADRVRAGARDLDAVLVGLPGGEALVDELLARGARRPLVIAACTSGSLDATRRAAAAGADLATVRPHHVERLAPILLAASRLVVQRRLGAYQKNPNAAPEPGDEDFDPLMSVDLDSESDIESESGSLQPFTVFQRAAEHQLARARRYSYPLTLAVFRVDIPQQPPPPPGVSGILRARAGNAIVNALRDIDIATELDRERFAVLLPHTDRLVGADIARRIISAVAAGDPVTLGGRTLPPKVIGAVAAARPTDAAAFTHLLEEATQLLEQAQVTGASLAVET